MSRVLICSNSIQDRPYLAQGIELDGRFRVEALVNLHNAPLTAARLRPDFAVIQYSADPKLLSKVQECSAHSTVVVCDVPPGEAGVECLLAGARGVVDDRGSADDIVLAFSALENCPVVCSDGLQYELFARLSRLASTRRFNRWMLSTDLSFQEARIMRLVTAGLSNKEISEEINLSVHTVKNHIHRILRKMGLPNRLRAADCFRALPSLAAIVADFLTIVPLP